MADPVNTGFDPYFGDPLRRFRAALAAQGIQTNIFSGVRDNQKQAQLYDNFLAGRAGQPLPHPELGPVPLAAPPGSSLHERGLAADIRPNNPADLQKMYALAGQYGIQPLGRSDPYHFQLANWRQAEATQPQNTAWDQSNPANVPTRMAMNMEGGAPPAAQGGLNLGNLSTALKQQESGDNYTAVNRSSGALGAYQIMPFNLPEWGKAAGYDGITPSQFLANPKAQDDIANAQLKSYATQYGNVNDVATAWYGGPKAVGNPNISGGKGYPTTGKYASQVVDKYNALGGGSQAPGPMDPTAQAGGPGAPLGTPGSTVNPPIPTTPGLTINSNPVAGGLGGQIGQLAGNLKKALGVDDDNKAQGQDQIKPLEAPPAPGARNVSTLLGNPQIYAQRMAGLNQPLSWNATPMGQGQMPGAGYGPQNQPVYGTSLMSQLQMLSDPTWMNQMAGG